MSFLTVSQPLKSVCLPFRLLSSPCQELLDLRDSQRPTDFVVQQLRKQATEVTESAVAMPVRVARIDDIIQQLESGDLKLRVRVLEVRKGRKGGSEGGSVNACQRISLPVIQSVIPLVCQPFGLSVSVLLSERGSSSASDGVGESMSG